MKVRFATNVGYCDSEVLPYSCQYTHIASLIRFTFHYCLKESIVIYVSGGLKREPVFVSLLAREREREREPDRETETERQTDTDTDRDRGRPRERQRQTEKEREREYYSQSSILT